MRRARIILVVAGIAFALLGVAIMGDTVKPVKILGLASWLVAAIIVHDAIIAPGVFAVGLVLRRAGRRVPAGVLAIIQGAIVLGSIFTLVVVPELLAQRFGHPDSSLLNADYGMRLGILWVVIAALTAVAILVYLAVRRRQKVRPPADQG